MCFLISGIAIVLALMCSQRAAQSLHATPPRSSLFRRVAYEAPELDLGREERQS
jgi:hypothetical protein